MVSGNIRHVIIVAAIVVVALGGDTVEAKGKPAVPNYLFNDSHFHLTNYIQQGTEIHRYLEIMGDKAGRSTLFGIPLQQTWSHGNSGDYAPTYYLQTDAPLYYYSFTDAYVARVRANVRSATSGISVPAGELR